MVISSAALAAAVVVAIAAGLYVGSQSRRRLGERRSPEDRPADRVRHAARKGVLRLWKWNRGRSKE